MSSFAVVSATLLVSETHLPNFFHYKAAVYLRKITGTIIEKGERGSSRGCLPDLSHRTLFIVPWIDT
jgi:hypothetical protein